jgi:hypothetical protein
VSAATLYYFYLPQKFEETIGLLITVAVASHIGILFQRYVFLPWSVKRDYRRSTFVSAPVNIEISPDGVQTRSEFGQFNLPWSQFLKWKENEEFILVYATKRFFHIYPKRLFLDTESLQEFRRILSNKVPHKQ